MSYNYVTVTGSFPGQSGTVTFAPPAVTDLTGTIPVLGPGTFAYAVSGGSFTTAPLLATDNAALLPAAWKWNVTVALSGARAYTYPVLIPSTGGSTVTLTALPVSASGGGAAAAFSNPMTTLGDLIYGGTAGVATRIAGSTSGTRNFFTQTGTGSASAAPAWATIAASDLPAINDPLLLGVNATFTQMATAATGAIGGSIASYIRFAAAGYSMSNIVIYVGASSGNTCVAAYTNSGTGLSATPTGGQLATTGSVPTPSIGQSTIALGNACTPKLADWAAVSADNGTATFLKTSNAFSAGLLGVPLAMFSNASFPLPATPSGVAANGNLTYLIRGA
jgi:hypothetical protein